MSTTKPATGWTREWPNQIGYHWFKSQDTTDEPCVMELSGGDTVYISELRMTRRQFLKQWGTGIEFLGPLSATDFEQLAALRSGATVALGILESLDRQTEEVRRAAAALHNALNPTNNQPKETDR